MTTIVTRAGKGSTLSWNEVDANFTNLNNDKAETTAVALKAPLASPTFTGTVSGITKSMVGLGNVDNTSDATKDAATATLTNKTITSPKIKAGQFGNSGTATNNFTITAEAADGTMKLARGNAGATTQDIMTVDTAGKPAFPQLAQLLVGGDGYAFLPNGILVQWGFNNTDVTGVCNEAFPITWPNECMQMVACGGTSNQLIVVNSFDETSYFVFANAADGGAGITAGFRWIAIGY